ncbi:MAG: hypothetical protein ACYTBS_07415 [Planctomycetota bacterium]|jgi:hypothetical protein
MRKQPKPGYLGPAFHAYLEYLEEVEHWFATGKGKGRGITINNRLFDTPKDEQKFNSLVADMMLVDASLARVVRSSVKYKMSVETAYTIADLYHKELIHLMHTVPLRLPHEYCTIVFEGFGQDDMILVAQEQTAEDKKTYPELGLEADEPFICLNIGAYRKEGVELEDGSIAPSNVLSHFPVEIHSQWNKTENENRVIYAGAGQVDPTKQGHRILDLMWRTWIIWHHQFHLQSLLRHKQVAGGRPPLSFKPNRLRKKHEHPAFEHTIIKLEVDAPDPSQAGRSIFQPRKRLHQVRGFWRHYRKSGKRVWVKPHWRGDETLGVIKRDIELVTHEGEDRQQA